jgi:FAD binding domain/Berberine and berberine like
MNTEAYYLSCGEKNRWAAKLSLRSLAMIPPSALQAFRESLRGHSFCPGDEGYDAARALPNAMIDRRPAVIARCTGAADVLACIRFAREKQVLVAVRGGGHSVAGKAVCDDGIVIDLSGMKGIRVDPANRTVRAQPGLVLGEFDKETQAFGLATTMGVVSKTGIAGLTMGGGWGHLSGKYGLALDNLIGVDAVTADGRLVTANASENEDFFWGVRGGGGNFGVVTSLQYRLHEVGPVLGGAVFFPVARTMEVLKFYREFADASPDELVTQAGVFTTPDGVVVFAVGACYCGPVSTGERILQPLRKFGPPLADLFSPMSYVQIQSMFDPFFPPGRQSYVKANFLRNLDDNAMEVFVELAGKSPSPLTFGPWLEHWHGAATRVPAMDTAFPHRQPSYNFMVWSNWINPSESEKNIHWTRSCFDAMRPFMGAGAYMNYLEDEGDPLARAAYGVNYDRLVGLKNKYDPANFFRMNHNIKPSQPAD